MEEAADLLGVARLHARLVLLGLELGLELALLALQPRLPHALPRHLSHLLVGRISRMAWRGELQNSPTFALRRDCWQASRPPLGAGSGSAARPECAESSQ